MYSRKLLYLILNILYFTVHGKNNFVEIFKNLAKYRFENNFIELLK